MRVCFAALLLVAALPVAAQEPAPAPAPAEAVEAADPTASERFLTALNRERERLGLPALRPSETLATAAQTHADDMAEKGYRALMSPEGLTIDDWVDETGYQPRVLGEKVAGGWLRPEALVEGWAEYPDEHRASVFHPEVLELGVGEARYDGAPLYVLVFGRSQVEDHAARAEAARAGEEAVLDELAAEVADLEAARERAVAELNRARKEAGLAELRRVPPLDEVALELAEARAAGQEIEDRRSHGQRLVARLRYERYVVRQMPGLEELAARGRLSAEDAVGVWLENEGDCDVVLHPGFTDIGLGAVVTPTGDVVWVALLSRARGVWG
jgi:uncharacterized protein YkwD